MQQKTTTPSKKQTKPIQSRTKQNENQANYLTGFTHEGSVHAFAVGTLPAHAFQHLCRGSLCGRVLTQGCLHALVAAFDQARDSRS